MPVGIVGRTSESVQVPADSAALDRAGRTGGLGSPPYGPGVRQVRRTDFQVRPGPYRTPMPWMSLKKGGLGSPPYGPGVRQVRRTDFQVRPGPPTPCRTRWKEGGLGSPPYGPGVRQVRRTDFQVRPGPLPTVTVPGPPEEGGLGSPPYGQGEPSTETILGKKFRQVFSLPPHPVVSAVSQLKSVVDLLFAQPMVKFLIAPRAGNRPCRSRSTAVSLGRWSRPHPAGDSRTFHPHPRGAGPN